MAARSSRDRSSPLILTIDNHLPSLRPASTCRKAEGSSSRMTITSGEATKIALDAALYGGYKGATVTATNHNDDENMFEVELEDESGREISVAIDGASGRVVELTTD